MNAKQKLIKQVEVNLRILRREEIVGGFNEASQYSEEILDKLIPMLSIKALKFLNNDIKETSILGLEETKKLLIAEGYKFEEESK